MVDREKLEIENPVLLKAWQEQLDDDAEYRAIVEAERRMGC